MPLTTAILLKNNSLNFRNPGLTVTAQSATDAAGVRDILMEAALTIMDCEDSVAAVDAVDKTLIHQLVGFDERRLDRIRDQRRQDLYSRHES